MTLRGGFGPGPLLVTSMLLAAGFSAPAAGLHFLADARAVEDAVVTVQPFARFTDFSGQFTRFEAGTFFSRARQESRLRGDWIGVSADVGGEMDSGRSLFHVSFSVDEPTPYWMSGAMEIAGGDGFACISLVDMAYHQEPLVNEIAFVPPGERSGMVLARTGWLAPGNYTLEAMVYAGGLGVAGRGSLELHFSIPEPGPRGLVVGMLIPAMIRWRRRHPVSGPALRG